MEETERILHFLSDCMQTESRHIPCAVMFTVRLHSLFRQKGLGSFAKMNGDSCSTKDNFKLWDVVLDTKEYV